MEKNKISTSEDAVKSSPEDEAEATAENTATNGTVHTRDVNARNVFGDPYMCCQFLREYTGLEYFKDISPEDIIDVTKKYHAYLGVEFTSDTVKKIVKKGQKTPLFLVSLIEHKSILDYNIIMQLLRYMVCIWTEHGKEMKSKGLGNPSNKDFKYPPIIPIVYYEGTKKWTVGMKLSDRIFMSELFQEYIPDFTYKLVCNYNYSNAELMSREDEMALFMMINKIQSNSDIPEFRKLDAERLQAIISKAPEQSLDIIGDALWSLLMKINIPVSEAQAMVERVKDRDMGYLFENIEKMDIQAERRNTAEARQKLAETEQKLEEALAELERVKDRDMGYLFENIEKMDIQAERRNTAEARQKLAETEQKLEESEQRLEEVKQEAEEAKARIRELEEMLAKMRG
ncbi:MAG: Rpn family recombination-promoting nuclease/putative transposase [Lachnospiraceae bacterium]|nr:Rpn family recombination-promoting nuclease/putative transposase [Lachnospiraceae bacterium]